MTRHEASERRDFYSKVHEDSGDLDIEKENDDRADPVEHPPHYTAHPSGVECIQVTEHMNFCLGNAIKYIWRAGLKSNAVEDLKKASWYIDREIQRLTKGA